MLEGLKENVLCHCFREGRYESLDEDEDLFFYKMWSRRAYICVQTQRKNASEYIFLRPLHALRSCMFTLNT